MYPRRTSTRTVESRVTPEVAIGEDSFVPGSRLVWDRRVYGKLETRLRSVRPIRKRVWKLMPNRVEAGRLSVLQC